MSHSFNVYDNVIRIILSINSALVHHREDEEDPFIKMVVIILSCSLYSDKESRISILRNFSETKLIYNYNKL